jgi:hypothetical protein
MTDKARRLVAALGGRWYRGYGMAQCPCHADGKTPALKISDAPARSGGVDVHCFAGCDWRDVKTALRDLRLLADGAWVNKPQSLPRIDPEKARAEAQKSQQHTAWARAIWRQARIAEGTLTAWYLEVRGIKILPPSIRHHRNLRHTLSGLWLPAMVACVQTVDGQFTAVHRTYLSPTEKGKAAVSTPKRLLGPCAGGAVRLARIGPELILGEGIETTLSAMHATGMPGWACMSTSGLRSVLLPQEVREVIILEDSDKPGRDAAAALAERLTGEGRMVRVARTPPGIKDFNDLLLASAT